MHPNDRPLGVMPFTIYRDKLQQTIEMSGGVDILYFYRKRLHEVRGAIMRYLSAGLPADERWIQEYNDLCGALGIKKREFRL